MQRLKRLKGNINYRYWFKLIELKLKQKHNQDLR